MSEPAVAIAFVDPARRVHGTARSGMSLLFEGASATSFAEGPTVERVASGWKVVLEGKLALEFAVTGAAPDLAGARAHVCTVAGQALGQGLDGMGVVTETTAPPSWQDLDALRVVHALFDREHAVLAMARRPAGSRGHGDELVVAHVLTAGELKAVEDARISTVYDGEGRPRQASMELWLPGEDFPRRAFGQVAAGASLAMGGLDVHAAVMSWRMDGREGAGLYELTVREPTPAAA